MFEQFEQQIQSALAHVYKKGKLNEQDIEAVLRNIRRALLESDVHFQVVKELTASLKVKLSGEKIQTSLDPASQVVKLVYESLVDFLGGKSFVFHLPKGKQQKILLVGLQGVGKTTTAGKLALFLKRAGHLPLLVGLDRKRYAADEQLRRLGRQIQVDVEIGEGSPAAFFAEQADKFAAYSVLLLDTAGRLHIDSELMDELKELKESCQPEHLFFIADALTGQDIVEQVKAFQEIGLTGVVLSKMDGDTRGGAALSLRHLTGLPIVFMGTGEKLGDLQPFHPERVARRLLGMGDMLSLLEKAEKTVTQEEAKSLEKKMRKGAFTLEDFRKQFGMIRKMGSLGEIVGMLGLKLNDKVDAAQGEKELKKVESMISSMTLEERMQPKILNGSRKRRIAKGSGRTVREINMLLKQFEMCKDVMRRMGQSKPNLLNSMKLWR